MVVKIKRRGSFRQFKSKQNPIVVRVENVVGIRYKGIRDKNIKKQYNVSAYYKISILRIE